MPRGMASSKQLAMMTEVLDAYCLRRGDEIVLASTDFDPRHAQRRRITAV